MPEKVSISKRRDVRIHPYLWNTSEHLFKMGQQKQTGYPYQFFASLIFTAFALEAYLNWLGPKLFPHWIYLERLKPQEKLAVVSDQLKVNTDYGRRPWQTVKLLFNFRNDLAHGKPEILSKDVRRRLMNTESI